MPNLLRKQVEQEILRKTLSELIEINRLTERDGTRNAPYKVLDREKNLLNPIIENVEGNVYIVVDSHYPIVYVEVVKELSGIDAKEVDISTILDIADGLFEKYAEKVTKFLISKSQLIYLQENASKLITNAIAFPFECPGTFPDGAHVQVGSVFLFTDAEKYLQFDRK